MASVRAKTPLNAGFQSNNIPQRLRKIREKGENPLPITSFHIDLDDASTIAWGPPRASGFHEPFGCTPLVLRKRLLRADTNGVLIYDRY